MQLFPGMSFYNYYGMCTRATPSAHICQLTLVSASADSKFMWLCRDLFKQDSNSHSQRAHALGLWLSNADLPRSQFLLWHVRTGLPLSSPQGGPHVGPLPAQRQCICIRNPRLVKGTSPQQ